MDMDHSSVNGWLAIVRAIHIASCMLIASVWAIDRLAVIGNARPWRRSALVLLLIAMPFALFSGIAWFLLVSASMSDLPFDVLIRNTHVLKLVWLHTRFGRTWQIHSAFWFAQAITIVIWSILGRGEWVGLVFGAALVAGLAWAGHGTTGPAIFWHTWMDVSHLLASSIWPAGLIPFACSLTQVGKAERSMQIYKVTNRFSNCSLIAVGVLTFTGLFNSWCLLGSLALLLTTLYGRVLLIKLTLFVGMVGLGAINMLILKPRLLRGANSIDRLWRNVLIEIVLGGGVLAVVGVLGLIEPTRH